MIIRTTMTINRLEKKKNERDLLFFGKEREHHLYKLTFKSDKKNRLTLEFAFYVRYFLE
jgi:hypothetical protein